VGVGCGGAVMKDLNGVAEVAGSGASAAVEFLRDSLRTAVGWAVATAARQAELVAILGQSLTLFLLSLVIARIGRPAARR